MSKSKKKNVKVRDLNPKKDAKGGGGYTSISGTGPAASGTGPAASGTGPSTSGFGTSNN